MATILIAASSSTFAGPEFDEGGMDAGSAPANARRVSGAAGPTAVAKVICQTSEALVTADEVDLIMVDIADPSAFLFTYSTDTGNFDSRLYLFRAVSNADSPGGYDAIPLVAFDNWFSDLHARFNNSSEIQKIIGGYGESFGPGRYFIACTGSPIQPMGMNVNEATVPLFNMAGPTIGLQTRLNSYRLASWTSGGATGNFTYTTAGIKLIYSDSCADAAFIEASSPTASFNTTSASSDGEPVPSPCSALTKDVWFRLRSSGGLVSVNTCESSFDTVVAVYRGSCDALTGLGCNDDSPKCSTQGGSALSLVLDGDGCTPADYFIRIGASSNSQGGSGNVSVSRSGGVLGDLDGNGRVDGVDLMTLLNEWGTTNAVADLNDDGVVDGFDLGILLLAWSSCS